MQHSHCSSDKPGGPHTQTCTHSRRVYPFLLRMPFTLTPCSLIKLHLSHNAMLNKWYFSTVGKCHMQYIQYSYSACYMGSLKQYNTYIVLNMQIQMAFFIPATLHWIENSSLSFSIKMFVFYDSKYTDSLCLTSNILNTNGTIIRDISLSLKYLELNLGFFAVYMVWWIKHIFWQLRDHRKPQLCPYVFPCCYCLCIPSL